MVWLGFPELVIIFVIVLFVLVSITRFTIADSCLSICAPWAAKVPSIYGMSYDDAQAAAR